MSYDLCFFLCSICLWWVDSKKQIFHLKKRKKYYHFLTFKEFVWWTFGSPRSGAILIKMSTPKIGTGGILSHFILDLWFITYITCLTINCSKYCRHHVYEKQGGPKSIELKEIGPRFELRLYQVSMVVLCSCLLRAS